MYPRSVSVALLVGAVLTIGIAVAVRPLVQSAGLVVRAAQLGGWVESTARTFATPVSQPPPVTVPTRHGPVPAQVYEPEGGAARTLLLIPGVHPLGMREPRLSALAREMAATGVRVVTVGLPDLMAYAITPEATDVIEDAVAWTASRADWARDGRVGLVGISFAGGLSVVAAGRESVRKQIAFVVSVGGHADLPRVMRYLATGESPVAAGAPAVPPHDFGVTVLLHGLVESGLVPPSQAALLREAVATYLAASQLALVDPEKAEVEFARARTLAAALPEPAATFMNHVNAREVRALGAALTPYLDRLGTGSPALSPARTTSVPSAPVFLLHGTEDSIIPTAETVLLEGDLRARGADVRVLISPLIMHAEVSRAVAAGALWELMTFWSAVLRR